jgi:hypothetical protein
MDWRTSWILVSEPTRQHSHGTDLDVRPCLLVTTRHDGGAVSCTLLASGNTGTDEADVLGSQVFCSAVGVGVVGVAAVNDDVALLGTTLQELLDEVVDGLAGHDEQHHPSGLLELRDEVLDGVGADDGLALGLCLVVSLVLCVGQYRGGTIAQEPFNLGHAVQLSVPRVGG